MSKPKLKLKRLNPAETPSRADYEMHTKTKEEWMEFMVNMVKVKSDMPNMSDKDIAGTIKRARPILFVTKQAKIDPDMPDCYYWNENKVARWIYSLGFPEVKEMFLRNNINGRRLVTIDASALNQMGMSNLTRMREVTAHIRKILGTTVPNALRALMRLVPWELYLKRKARTGVETDVLTFKAFCKERGFPYSLLRKNKCAYIPCTCPVEVKLGCKHQPDPETCAQQSERGSDSSSDNSMKYCPSVENTVRKLPIRDRIIQQVLDELNKTVIDRIGEIEAAKEAEAEALKLQMLQDRSLELKVRQIFFEAFEALGINGPDLSQSRVDFIASVAEELVNDVCKTREILDDMDSFKSYMENSMDPATMQNALEIASEFLDEVSAISTMLTLGQLELEALIKDAPYIQSYVDEIIQTAEQRISSKKSLSGHTNDKPSSTSTSIKTILSSTRSSLQKNSQTTII